MGGQTKSAFRKNKGEENQGLIRFTSSCSYLLGGLEAQANIVTLAGDLLAARQDLLSVQEHVQLFLKRPFVLQDNTHD